MGWGGTYDNRIYCIKIDCMQQDGTLLRCNSLLVIVLAAGPLHRTSKKVKRYQERNIPQRLSALQAPGGRSQVHWIPHKPISWSMTSPERANPPCSAVCYELFFSLGVICGTTWWDINSLRCVVKTGTFKGLYLSLFCLFFSTDKCIMVNVAGLEKLFPGSLYVSFMVV